jgi:hypothetical protein
MINKNTHREYELQQAIKKVKGRTLIEDTRGFYGQYRHMETDPDTGERVELQWLEKGVYEDRPCKCGIYLGRWLANEETCCRKCKTKTMKGDFTKKDYRAWVCLDHDYQICLTCIPVVLRTPFRE